MLSYYFLWSIIIQTHKTHQSGNAPTHKMHQCNLDELFKLHINSRQKIIVFSSIKQTLLVICSLVVENVPGGRAKLVYVYMSVCSFVLVQVVQEWIALSSSTPLHLSSPFVLKKTETKEKRVNLRVLNFCPHLIFEYSGQYRGLSCFPSLLWATK